MMVSELAERRTDTLQDRKRGRIRSDERKESHASESSFLTSNGATFVTEQEVPSVNIEPTLLSDSPFAMNMQLNVVWVVLLGLSFGTRMWQLTIPKYVVFDEVHFGKFTNFFMQNKFFFDIHPPLGKLIFALTAYLSGYDGSFSFDEIGQGFILPVDTDPVLLHELHTTFFSCFDSSIQIIQHHEKKEKHQYFSRSIQFSIDLEDYEPFIWILRSVPAFLGSLIAPCIYEIILDLGCSHWAASFGALLVIFENMLIVQTRFMFLDASLLFFSVSSVMCYLKFRIQNQRCAFTFSWWIWLMLLGLSLTGACSSKYCAVMTLLTIGSVMCMDFWKMIGDKAISNKDLTRHFAARVICLAVIPLVLYLLQFFVLFTVLYKTGPHDDMMSSPFQASLEGGLSRITRGQAQEVAYGSQITLRHTAGRQCWLHSHAHNYPIKYPDGRGSSHQQQVTCYGFKDVNNWWIVKDPESDSLQVEYPPRAVLNGDIIQLIHGVSGRALNSHDVAAPLSPTNQEVSCYIDYNISMHAQNLWKLEIVNPDSTNKWRTIQSEVRFIHVNTSQAVRITGSQLPDWGFHQFEVATDRVINQRDTSWNVEEHQQNISYPEGYTPEKEESPTEALVSKPMPFFRKFFEMQLKMIESNKELSGEHTFSSTPFHWPIMKRGVAYWIHKNLNMQIYCIGNPMVWWTSAVSLIAYSLLLMFYLLRRRRAVYDIDNDAWDRYCFLGHLLVIGYFLHYLPYFAMERTLFIHHYLPALLFQIILLSVVVEHFYYYIIVNRYLRYVLLTVFTLLCIAVVITYHIFSPFTYGHIGLTSAEINQRRWLPLWDMLAHPDT